VTLTPPATPRAALGRLAREVLEILSGPHAGELHTCEGGDCRMVFIDPTGRRRWCSTAVCGNRERVRRFRERQRG
jgi:predicted RNA-binding Zn ribbon-like protein